MTNNLIDLSGPGEWETFRSYHESAKMWRKETHPMFKRAKEKELARYQYLRVKAGL